MILFVCLFIISFVHADPSWKWTNAIKIVEKHEFYVDNEVIVKPKDSWQLLFAVLYHDSNLKTYKDCIFYRVPGLEMGTLKIKSVPANTGCEKFLYEPGDQEWKDLKAVQYSLLGNLLTLSQTNSKFQIETWNVPLFNVFEHPAPKGLMSSAEYRSPRAIYLAPYKGVLAVRPQPSTLKLDKKICHDVGDDCLEKTPSVCTQCPEGWYEIPNGCGQGPKFCGSVECGLKNQPACRRGMKFQRIKSEYQCGEDQLFAYCAKGLRIDCRSNLPYCI
jgi:hypothetical protein